MRINKINFLPKYNYNFNNPKQQQEEPQTTVTNPINIAFEARVDKGLTRFYQANADRMPKTVKTYIENLSDKTAQTPLSAQRSAFAGLIGVSSIAAVKLAFPEEELFSDLKETNESKATRGILGVYRENKELLEVCEQGILNNNENFTVWLLKKIFLESKTIEEINQDLSKEINPEFKSMYDTKEKNDQLIRHGTLKALGIKLPEFEYMQSLRYTRLGYSDLIGEKISIANRNFWDSMPPEERTARNKKSVEKFENWWNSMTRGEKLDMIAEQMTELDMLEKFNTSDIGKVRKSQKTETPTKIEHASKEKREKIDTSLSRDDLFKIWAGNNLKLFMESLTEYDKRRIEMRREQKRAEWWNSMSAKERTEYINGLKTASEPIRYAMIDAWNKNPDILAALSIAMKQGHVEKPIDAIYGSEKFNEHLSQIMTDFWANNPEFAEKFGTSIQEAHINVKEALENGSFEILKREIMKARVQREKDVIKQVNEHKEIFSNTEYNEFPEHIKDFIKAYTTQSGFDMKLFPVEYLRDFFNTANTDLIEEEVISWTKALYHETMTEKDYANLHKINNTELPLAAIMNRALEATFADVLYKCTGDARVYLMSQADCKMALNQVKNNYPYIAIGSLKLKQELKMPILNKEINIKTIEKLYSKYKERLTEEEAEWIIEQFFKFDVKNFENERDIETVKKLLKSYIMLYGRSSEIIFSLYSSCPAEVKAAFAQKFLQNMPLELSADKVDLLVKTKSDFEREKEILNINNKFRNKYQFLPERLFETYIIEIDRILRQSKSLNLKYFENAFCKRNRSTKETIDKTLNIPRLFLTNFNSYAFLSIEQTLADELYKSTGEPKVYALTLEELLETIESIYSIKKFKNEKISIHSTLLKETFTIKPKLRPGLHNSLERSREYNNELISYANNCLHKNENFDPQEILFILNPEENAPEIDKYTTIRIDNSKIL